jgi:hypothetical protein
LSVLDLHSIIECITGAQRLHPVGSTAGTSHSRWAGGQGRCARPCRRAGWRVAPCAHILLRTDNLSSTGIRRGSARQPRGYPRAPDRPAATAVAAQALRAHTHSRAHPRDAWQRRLSRGRVAAHARAVPQRAMGGEPRCRRVVVPARPVRHGSSPRDPCSRPSAAVAAGGPSGQTPSV